MEITKDKFAILEYSVRLEDGTYVKGEGCNASLNFVAGYDQILPALEKQLIGMSAGTETEFVITADNAFGAYDEALVETRSFADFPEGRNLETGKWVIASNKQTGAQYSYYVRQKTSEAVALDFNHPLAGKDLYYHVKVIHVRPALAEELEFLRPCQHGVDSGTNQGPLPVSS